MRRRLANRDIAPSTGRAQGLRGRTLPASRSHSSLSTGWGYPRNGVLPAAAISAVFSRARRHVCECESFYARCSQNPDWAAPFRPLDNVDRSNSPRGIPRVSLSCRRAGPCSSPGEAPPPPWRSVPSRRPRSSSPRTERPAAAGPPCTTPALLRQSLNLLPSHRVPRRATF